MRNNLNPKVKYFKKNNLINLEIMSIKLERIDVTNLINKILCIGNIKTPLLKVNEPSSAIGILSWYRKSSSIISTILE